MNLIVVARYYIISYVLVHNLKLYVTTQHTLCHYIISCVQCFSVWTMNLIIVARSAVYRAQPETVCTQHTQHTQHALCSADLYVSVGFSLFPL